MDELEEMLLENDIELVPSDKYHDTMIAKIRSKDAPFAEVKDIDLLLEHCELEFIAGELKMHKKAFMKQEGKS